MGWTITRCRCRWAWKRKFHSDLPPAACGTVPLVGDMDGGHGDAAGGVFLRQGAMMRLIDLTGKVFGKLTVVSRAPSSRAKQTRWHCVCECGNKKVVQATNLANGHIASCGCWKHGLIGTITYSSWSAMKSRCLSPDNPNYPMYGARGITVCQRWKDSFLAFLEDMGERPSLSYSIDRINGDGNYEPGNCRWATRSEQRKNQRQGLRGKFLEFNGEALCIRAWAAKLGIKEHTLAFRIRVGWSTHDALTVPVLKRSAIKCH